MACECDPQRINYLGLGRYSFEIEPPWPLLGQMPTAPEPRQEIKDDATVHAPEAA